MHRGQPSPVTPSAPCSFPGSGTDVQTTYTLQELLLALTKLTLLHSSATPVPAVISAKASVAVGPGFQVRVGNENP